MHADSAARREDTTDPAGLVIEMLPARHGDCLLVEWGPGKPRHRMLIDAGPGPAYPGISGRLRELGVDRLDVVVLTHVDADHVEGLILLLNDRELDLAVGEVWYNGSPQLFRDLGAVQGELLGAVIATRELAWNTTFAGRTIGAGAPDAPLPRISVCGGLSVTVLGPDDGSLDRLRGEWIAACKEAGLTSGSTEEALQRLRDRPGLLPKHTYLAPPPILDVTELANQRQSWDTKVANRSSVVLLLEAGGRSALLAGDATPVALAAGVRRYLAEHEHRDRLQVDAFKLPHHGSARNVSREIVALVPAGHYLVSTDGGYFGHPDDAAVATVLFNAGQASELWFNYDTDRTRQWDDPRLYDRWAYRAHYPEPGTVGCRLELAVTSGG
jgi:hypothetical protein